MNIKQKVKALVPESIFEKLAPYYHFAESVFFQVTNDFPADNLTVIGVTGTDGKTSTSSMIAHILKHSGAKTAMLGTIDFDLGMGPEDNNSRLTTVGARSLVKLIRKARDNGCKYLVLETTSHALAEYRTWGIKYSVVAMTNVGHEHLDYHKTFESYRSAKLKLFKLANANKDGLQLGVINAEDASAKLFSDAIKNKLSYGLKSGNLHPEKLKMTPSGSSYSLNFEFQAKKRSMNIKLNLPGDFNVANSLAAIGVCLGLGLSDEQIESGLSDLKQVKGRMHKVDEGQNFDVIVDYAHTPDSFRKIFNMLRPIAKKRIITVFGSAGRRDEQKRYTQGEIAGQYSDIVIATEEDDRDQDGMEILKQIAEGAKSSNKVEGENLFLIHKRVEAVNKAVEMAEDGDLVLLLGKGHEQSILTNKPGVKLKHSDVFDEAEHTLKIDYNEEEVARLAIRNKLKA